MAIDQSDIEFVTTGNQVQLLLSQNPNGQLLESEIDVISTTEMESVPKALNSQYGGTIQTKPSAEQQSTPISAMYQVKVPLGNLNNQVVTAGSVGYARIRTGNQTVGNRIWRFFCKTFRFDL